MLTYSGNIIDYRYDPDVQAWLNQLTGTTAPSDTYISYLTTFVVQLKAYGIWGQLDRLWIFATEQQAHARVSIVNPTSTHITEVPNGGALTWTKNQGYTGDGTHSYLNTNVSLSALTNYSLNSASLFIYSRTNLSQSNIVDYGTRDVTNWTNINIRNAGNLFNGFVNNQSTQITEVNVSNSLGGFGEVRTSSTTGNLYQNGVSLTATTTNFVSNAIPGPNLYVCAMNTNGVVANFTTRQYSCFAIGSGTINQTYLYNAFQTFATQVGFNV